MTEPEADERDPALTRVVGGSVSARGELLPPRHIEEALAQVERANGGRMAIATRLSTVSDQALQHVAGLLADPHHDRYSLARILAKAGITLQQLLIALRDGKLAEAQAAAVGEIADGLPLVARDVVRRSAPYTIPCDLCQETGTFTPEPSQKNPNPFPMRCLECNGRGYREILPDLARQKVALEIGGLLKSGGGGVQVNVQQNAHTHVHGAFDRLQGVVDTFLDRELYGVSAAPAREVDVVDAEEVKVEGDVDAGSD